MVRSLLCFLSLALSLGLAGCGVATPVINPPQASLETVVPNRLVVFYHSGSVPASASAMAARAGAQVISHMPALGLSSVQVAGDPQAAIDALLAQPEVSAVLHDRYITVDRLQLHADTTSYVNGPLPQSPHITSTVEKPFITPESDYFYETPQGWAVQSAGGYGKDIPGGPLTGPWNTATGAGVRIAVLDSGVDPTHPDIAPNLVLNLSEVNQTALPSVCDDGSPVDQTGHGTFTASLAAAAQGPGTGLIIGVAPHAAILNIKVVERMPATTPGTTLSQCEAGEGAGYLSWVLQGIQDAISNHANIISASLGTLVDTTTGDGAGWVTQMNAITYAASQAGVVIIAAAGNDSLNLATSNYVDLPAQARNVLPVVASTNPACAEDTAANATCVPGPVTRAYYSNYGSTLNAIAAPGGSFPGGTTFGVSGFVRGACARGLANTTDGLPSVGGQSLGCFNLGHTAYVQAIGTSASAPLVAGAAALLLSAHPTWTPAQVIAALRSTAVTTSSMTEPELNLPAALALN